MNNRIIIIVSVFLLFIGVLLPVTAEEEGTLAVYIQRREQATEKDKNDWPKGFKGFSVGDPYIKNNRLEIKGTAEIRRFEIGSYSESGDEGIIYVFVGGERRDVDHSNRKRTGFLKTDKDITEYYSIDWTFTFDLSDVPEKFGRTLNFRVTKMLHTWGGFANDHLIGIMATFQVHREGKDYTIKTLQKIPEPTPAPVITIKMKEDADAGRNGDGHSVPDEESVKQKVYRIWRELEKAKKDLWMLDADERRTFLSKVLGDWFAEGELKSAITEELAQLYESRHERDEMEKILGVDYGDSDLDYRVKSYLFDNLVTNLVNSGVEATGLILDMKRNVKNVSSAIDSIIYTEDELAYKQMSEVKDYLGLSRLESEQFIAFRRPAPDSVLNFIKRTAKKVPVIGKGVKYCEKKMYDKNRRFAKWSSLVYQRTAKQLKTLLKEESGDRKKAITKAREVMLADPVFTTTDRQDSFDLSVYDTPEKYYDAMVEKMERDGAFARMGGVK
jgi:hypothetical protein